MQEADIVIVGGGSAGCVLAARLSEDPALKVVLVEAGLPSRNPWLRIPIGYFKTVGHPQHDWRFETDPEPEMAQRRLPWPRGRGPGGSSLINGMLYLRGHRADYDQWAALGNPGWDWDSVRPYFDRSQPAADGPLWVSQLPRDVLSDAFIAAAAQAGIAPTADFNGGDNSGAGYFRMTTRRGRRMDTGRAFLAPALGRPNLTVLSGAQATRVRFAGRRATGVEYLREGQAGVVSARHEVILSAGAIQSPQLLQLSGVGPADLLGRFGIPVVAPLEGVGRNLQDHLQVRPSYRCTGVETLNDIAHSPWRSAREFVRYVATRGGALNGGVYRAGAFFSAGDEAVGWPDAQIHFGLVSFERPHQPPHPFPGVTLSACLLRPHSRGEIALRSADPLAPPSIRPRYLSHEADRTLAVQLVRKMREIAAAPPLARYLAQEHEPGHALASDAQLLDWVRRRGGSIFHPVGTCAMGPAADDDAVVDARLRVHGLQGLRVVDGSVMPRLVSGNTNAPIIMIAERASDLVRQDLAA
ncbi:GMC family oxidoreductase [Acidovorax cavernicola]|uniref:Choline dehydrogenase n=1 Tax=Acidovorax cavernicola TaxID=1675792 RepID=A0A9X8D3V4_9BURK|nr:GMC family oxidoreductase N-terminal domain-containing protein [Acidovorax cavernicola]RIX78144.1 choline dehydrogenase [Acidovorax cavernicola]